MLIGNTRYTLKRPFLAIIEENSCQIVLVVAQKHFSTGVDRSTRKADYRSTEDPVGT
jgi:hypothetical protein